MTEIELKVALDDPEPIRSHLASFAVALGAVNKFDTYWRYPAAASSKGQKLPTSVRVRREAAESLAATVSFKHKTRRDGLEINDEHDFKVNPALEFEELLLTLGFGVELRKHKTGSAWRIGRVLAELVELSGLGWFIELEILTDDANEATIAKARSELTAVLRRLGLSETAIETRYYSELMSMAGLRLPK